MIAIVADMFKECLKKEGKRTLEREMKTKFGNKKGYFASLT